MQHMISPERVPRMRSPSSVAMVFAILLSLSVGAQAQPAPAAMPMTHVNLGKSVVALNGPWKFHIGDSPFNAQTHSFAWADPEFDDSQWDTVDLTPENGAYDPV